MKQLIYLFACVIIMASCQTKKENVAIVNGKVLQNADQVSFEWFKKNSADVYPDKHTATVDSSGNFSIDIPISELTKGLMLVNDLRYDIILVPAETLEIIISKDTIEFLGDGAKRNSFFYKLSKNTKASRMDIMRSWYTRDNHFEDLYSMAEDFKDERVKALENYKSLAKYDKAFIDYFAIETNLDYLDLIHQAPLAYSRKNSLNMDSIELPEAYKEPLHINEVMDDANLVSASYLMLLNGLIHEASNEMVKNDSTLTENQAKLSIIMDSLSGKTREHYLAQTIYYKFSIHDTYDSLIIHAFDSIKIDPNCMATVNKQKEKYEKKKAMIGAPLHADFLQTVLFDTANVNVSMQDVLAKSAGKVIYIDTWSLGCGPCRMAMPHSKSIKEELKDLPIEFIYLTIDTYSDKLWDESFEVSLTKNNHYRFEKGFKSKLHQLFNIMAVPTYLLIDKQGNLVSYKAERPFDNGWNDNPKLIEQLKALALQ